MQEGTTKFDGEFKLFRKLCFGARNRSRRLVGRNVIGAKFVVVVILIQTKDRLERKM